MANLVLKQIDIKNFMSVGHVTLNLQNLGVVKVSGVNYSEGKASSNGSGKSTISSESILYALTGETNKDAKNINNLNTNKPAEVTLDFSLDNKNYRITRTDGGSKSLKIIKDGKDISGNTLTKSKEILNEELGFINKDIISSIIVLGQNLNGKFSALKPSERKGRLEYLVGVDNLLQNIQSLLENAEGEINDKLNELSKKQTEYETIINSNKDIIKKYENLPKLDETAFEEVKNQRLEKAKKYNEIKDEVGALLSKKNALHESKDPINKELLDNNNEINTIQKEIDKKANDVKFKKQAISTVDEKLAELNKQTEFAAKQECPTCHQHLSDKELEKHLKEETSKLNDSKTKLEKELNDLISSSDSTAQINKIAELNKKNTDKNNELTRIQKEISDITEEKEAKEKEGMAIYSEIQELDEKIKIYNKQKVELSSIDGVLSSAKKNIAEATKSLKELEKDIQKANRDKDIHKYFKNSVSRKFRNFLLEGVFNYLNKKLDSFSKSLFDNYIIKLENNGNNIDVRVGEKYYEDCSGGEQRKIDIAIQLALRALAKEQRCFSSSFICLDEVLENCDSAAADIMLKFIENQISDVNTIFFTTHNANVNIQYDKILEVTKGTDEITTCEFIN